MPWNPESGLPLTEEMDADHLEETSMKLWAEFIKGYFDGQTHGLQAYPSCELAFQQRPFTQELNGIGIRIVSNVPGGTRPRRMNDEWWLDNPAKWTFIVSARVTGNRSDGHTSDSLCRLASDALYALLLKWDRTLWLSRAGIIHIRCKPPVLATSAEFSARKMLVSGTIHVPVETPGVLQVSSDGDVLRVG